MSNRYDQKFMRDFRFCMPDEPEPRPMAHAESIREMFDPPKTGRQWRELAQYWEERASEYRRRAERWRRKWAWTFGMLIVVVTAVTMPILPVIVERIMRMVVGG